MEIFIDTANIDDIKKANDWGILDGVTTNPSLVAKENKPFTQIVKEISAIVKGDVSAEVIATDYDGIVKEARILAKIVDVPIAIADATTLTEAGYVGEDSEALKDLEPISTNIRDYMTPEDVERSLGIEDLVEELVGEIADESDVTPNTIIRLDRNTIVVHGNTPVSRINNFFNVDLPLKRKDIEVYELILQNVKKPFNGEKFKINDMTFLLEDVRDSEILKIRITRKKDCISQMEGLVNYKKILKI